MQNLKAIAASYISNLNLMNLLNQVSNDIGTSSPDFSVGGSDVVLESDYNADSVLTATTDNTPVATTLAEQTVLGRLTGGHPAAVAIGIADNNMVQIDGADIADNEYARFTAAGLESRTAAEVASDVQGSIKLDDLATPDDNTDLDVSTTRHGLAPKAVAPAAGTLNVYGIANAETAITNKTLFDAVHPEDLGVAAEGSQVIAARRDHVHKIPTLAELGAEAEAHAADHAVGAADTVFPADPNADRYLMWDDDPGALVWAPPAGTGDFKADGSVPLTGDIDFAGTQQCHDLQAPAAAGEAIRQTAAITEAALEAVIAAPPAHAASHAVGGADTILPADPGADKYLMWDDSESALAWGAGGAGGGDVATDVIWDAAGDLAVGTGADTAAKVNIGAEEVVGRIGAGNVDGIAMAEQTVLARLTGASIDDVAIGIADNNMVQIDDADAADNQVAVFTAAGIEGVNVGIANANMVKVDAADVADNDYAKFTANGLEGRSYAEVLSDIGAGGGDETLVWLGV